MSAAESISYGKKRLAPLAVVLLISLIIPANFYLGSIYLTPSRIVAACVLPYLLVRLLTGAYGGVLLTDILILLFVFWALVAMLVNNPDLAIVFVGLKALSMLGGYVVARATIRTIDDFYAFVKFYAVIMVLFLPFAFYESVTSQFVIPKLVAAIPGVSSITDVNYERRLGLDRAQVVFSHPILFGLYCSMPVALYYVGLSGVASATKRKLVVGVCLLNCIFAVSSGPLLSAFLQLGLIAYGKVTKSIEKQWKLLMAGLAVLYVAIELYSPYPALYEISKRVALNSATALNRSLIFEYGSIQVGKTPWFGVGLNDWDRPIWMKASIDNHWMLVAVQFGLPAFILLFGVFMNSLIRAGGGKFRRGSELYNVRLAWNFVLISVMLTMATVALFGEVISMVFFVLGAGSFLFYTREDDAATNAPAAPRPERRTILGDDESGGSAPASPPDADVAESGPGFGKGRRTVFR